MVSAMDGRQQRITSLIAPRARKGLVEFLLQRLGPGEEPLAAVTGLIGTSFGIAVIVCATTQKLIIGGSGLGSTERHEFPYDRISSISLAGSLGTYKLQINAGGARTTVLVYNIRNRARAELVVATVLAQINHQPEVPAERDQPLALIAELAGLRDAGAITVSEFEEKKTELLRRV
jgi:Bacterial PH domain/Short C-terminal domain